MELADVSQQRRRVLHSVAHALPDAADGAFVRVGIDGVDGAGKTMFADELSAVVHERGRSVIRVSADDFHNIRSIRHRRGRDSPEGFWLDSYNYARLRADVLDPLAPQGSGRYRPFAHDLATDSVLNPPWLDARPGSVLIVDGLFLHRNELADIWTVSVFLDVPFDVSARRMADRDGSDPNPNHPSMRRYVEGQRIYFAACAPHLRADFVIDNTDVAAPQVIPRA